MNSRQWERRVDRDFGYLRTEFDCAIVDRSDKDWWETSVTYQNATTAVKVARSEEFDCVETDMIRLVDGARPPYPVFVSATPKLHQFGLGNLLMIRAPELWNEMKEQKGLSDDAIAAQLAGAASALREFGADVLRGDFGSFEEMEARVRAVARETEGITIWSPGGPGDSSAVADTIAKIRASYPTVPVATANYRRPVVRRTLWERLRSLLKLIAGRAE
jgi:hypothetical protein